MSYGYYRKKRARRKSQSWLFAVISFSIAAAYFYYVHTHILSMHIAPPAIKNVSPIKKQEPSEFDFYSMLPKIQVQVKANGSPNTPELTSGQTYYVLQIATINDPAAADDFLTKLGVMGLNAYVKPYQKSSGATGYRILVGPYTTQKDMDTDQSYLKTNHIRSLVLTAKAP